MTVTGQETNVGTGYTATAASLDNDNYKLPAANTQTFAITENDNTTKDDLTDAQKATGNTGLVYNGTDQALVTAPSELPTGYTGVQYSTDGGTTWSNEIPTGHDADDYSGLRGRSDQCNDREA